jgi:ABC-2 type transport system permease protein
MLILNFLQQTFSSFRIAHPLRVLKTLMSVYYAYIMEYRAEIVLWVLSGSLPFIMLGVWSQSAGQGADYGLDQITFIRYFLAVFLARQFTVIWVFWEFERELVEGQLSFRLLHPIDPFWHHLVQHIGERLTRFPFIFLLIIFFFVLYPQAFWIPSLGQLVGFTIAVNLAFILHFMIHYTFSMVVFWVERARSIENLWFFTYLFLSGFIAPLDVFPQTLVQVLSWTPIPYLIYFPAALLLGLPVSIFKGFSIMLAWLLAITIVNRWAWHQGLKKYSGMGA